MRRWLLLLVAALLLAPAATAAPPPPLHFDMLTAGDWQNPVEQWTEWDAPCGVLCSDQAGWVTNPYRFGADPCAWDVDDHWERIATDDSLPAGATVNVSACFVADPNPIVQNHYGLLTDWSYPARSLSVDVFSQQPLTVTVCYQPQGRCFASPPAFNASRGQWEQKACIAVQYATTDPAVQPVAGSNGGSGVVTHATVTVTNATKKAVRQITGEIAQVGAGSTGAWGCSAGGTPQASYPFTWLA